MDPAFWGRSTWKHFDALVFSYPTVPSLEDKEKYYKYFELMGDMLPCPSCAASYKIYFQYIHLKDYLDDIHGMTYWVYNIHCLVNKKLKKNNITFEKYYNTYYPHKTKCTVKNVITNPNEKCTANPATVTNSNGFIEFNKITHEKYDAKLSVQVMKLFNEHPELK